MYRQIRKSVDKSDRGFTLIELLVVIIMIGILAAIAIPDFLHQRSKAIEAGEKTDTRTIATQFESYYTDNEAYPKAADVQRAVSPTGVETLTIGQESVVLSPANTAAISSTAAGNAYCIVISNSQATQPWVWESDNGGLQPSGTKTCGSTYTSTIL